MKVYLAEYWVGRNEPIGVFSTKKKALEAVGKRTGIVTELLVDENYNKGIGLALHSHTREGKIEVDEIEG